MNIDGLQHASRREFLRGSARYGALSLCAAVTLWNLRQGARFLSTETCRNDGLCAGCAVFDECGLPNALSFKSRNSER